MLYIVLLISAFLFWWFVSWLGRTLSELKRRLEKIETIQADTLDFVRHAVNEFAFISGETKEDDLEREPLANRIDGFRRDLNVKREHLLRDSKDGD